MGAQPRGAGIQAKSMGPGAKTADPGIPPAQGATPGSRATGHMMEQLMIESDFSRFASRNDDAFLDGTVAEHLQYLLKKYLVDKNGAITRADIDRCYGYQILSGKREAGRDKLIRLAFGIGLTVEDTQRLLTVAGKGSLYPKIKRDAGILFCLGRGYTILQTANFLYDMGLAPLE